jgi:ribosomal-protein-alanine N-acetyltransferase
MVSLLIAVNRITEPGIMIREYRESDFPEVLEMERAGVHPAYRSAVFVRQMGELCPGTFFVAAAGERLIGYTIGASVQDDPGRAWILRMVVQEAFRCRGIGTALLGTVTNALQKRNACQLFLTVSPKNPAAIHLYTHQGFITVTRHSAYFGPGEDRIVMRKVLEP